MSKLDVTVNARHLAGQRTGIEVYMEQLLAALALTGDVQITATTWVPTGLDRENLREVVAARRPEFGSGTAGTLRAMAWKLWFDQWRCTRAVADARPMLFHGMDGFLPYSLRRRDRAVVTVHDLGWQAHPELYPRKLRVMYGSLFPWAVRRADRFITVSRFTADDLMRRAGVPASRIRVVHHGLDPAFLVAGDGHAPDTDGPPYLLAVGGVSPRKNTPRLLEAFTRWRGRGGPRTHFRLRITGASLHPEYDDPGAKPPPGVELLGYVGKDELTRLYAGAAGFLYPSIYEGFGLPILEAMAAGTPVLSSTTGSAPEVAGDAAILVDPFDVDAIVLGLDRLLERTEADRLRALGRVRARRSTWERAAAETVEVYRRLG